MEHESSSPFPSGQLLQLVDALERIRDSCVEISLALKDFTAATPSKARDDVVTEVERYLANFRLRSGNEFD